jgi:hypothetical protein
VQYGWPQMEVTVLGAPVALVLGEVRTMRARSRSPARMRRSPIISAGRRGHGLRAHSYHITGALGPGCAKKPGRMASPVGDAQYTVRAAGNNWPQVGVISPTNPAPNPQC